MHEQEIDAIEETPKCDADDQLMQFHHLPTEQTATEKLSKQ